jgi:L-malate glycosyltransferase
MKILVFVDRLIVGGVPINAIDLAACLRDRHGHDVVIYGTAGPAVRLAEEQGLRFIPAPVARTRPSLSRMRSLRRVVRSERPDLIQAWDWAACLDAYYIEHLCMGVPLMVSHSTMHLERLLPRSVPTTYMTPELIDHAAIARRLPVRLLLPPVNVVENAPGVANGDLFRRSQGLAPAEILIVTVSRLDNWIKAESLIRTIKVVKHLAKKLPIVFAIVGDGEARPELERLAAEANSEVGRRAVVLTGELLDPREAYAAADIVVGMGGSALRALAFAKPTVVVGKIGFARMFSPESAALFLYQGMYGSGDGTDNELTLSIQSLATDARLRVETGEFSRKFLVEHFSLEVVGAILDRFCAETAIHKSSKTRALGEGIRTAAIHAASHLLPAGAKNWIRRSLMRGGTASV